MREAYKRALSAFDNWATDPRVRRQCSNKVFPFREQDTIWLSEEPSRAHSSARVVDSQQAKRTVECQNKLEDASSIA